FASGNAPAGVGEIRARPIATTGDTAIRASNPTTVCDASKEKRDFSTFDAAAAPLCPAAETDLSRETELEVVSLCPVIFTSLASLSCLLPTVKTPSSAASRP